MITGIILEKMKSLESTIKKYLTIRFGKYLSEQKMNLMYSKNYVQDLDFDNADSEEQANGVLLRGILGSLIDIKCSKNLNVSENETKEIIYGEDLEQSLIEEYAQELASIYNINMDNKPELKEDAQTIKKLKEKLNNGLDPLVFNSNAIEILDAAQTKELINEYDNKAIEKYVKKKEKTENIRVGSKEEEKHIDEELTKTGRIQIVFLQGKEYVKYVDEIGEPHLVETKNPTLVSDVFKNAIGDLKPGEELDPEKFFELLTLKEEEVKLVKKKDLNKNHLTSEEVNMINFVHNNKHVELTNASDTTVLTDADNAQIHIDTDTNNLMSTAVVGGVITSEVIKDGTDSLTNMNTTNGVQVGDIPGENVQEKQGKVETEELKPLTEEEYYSYCEKFIKGEELPLEVLQQLKSSPLNEKLAVENNLNIQNEEPEIIQEESGPVLGMHGSSWRASGFTNKYLAFLIVGIIVCIGITLGALLFKIAGR